MQTSTNICWSPALFLSADTIVRGRAQAERTYSLDNRYSLFDDNTESLLLLIVANTTIYDGGEAFGATLRTNELDIRRCSTAACAAGGPWGACLVSVRAAGCPCCAFCRSALLNSGQCDATHCLHGKQGLLPALPGAPNQ